MMVVATSVSTSEKPRSLLKLDFAKGVHRDVSRLALSAHRDRGARRGDVGHGLPAPASACTLPSGQNSSVGNAVNVACGCRRRSAPSLFGRVSRLASAPVGRCG